ncbi:uncharacterized protein RAG0_04618 [Rhynchosporium agropyri]|uniref:ubiquitinyl hydrolase 1 n=1 Tax=Rhynchosporium agropyri TaxID=914238 RepID=A0A1E1K9M5_9HELO|nr:uncharacterized protein RAG0_04618 [Rhynchosporium agropyri]
MSSDNEPPDSPAELPLEFIINHVFLPQSFLSRTTQPQKDEQDAWTHLPPMLEFIKQAGDLESQVEKLDEKITEMVVGDAVALHLTHQNAGLILRKQRDTYSVETFELSASYTATNSTIGRLIRRFPGPVIAVSNEQVKDDNFRQHFIRCLGSLDSDNLDEALSIGQGSIRDSVHPQFATEWLPGLLRGIGSPLNVSRVYKRTRDEVNWAEGSSEPWHRSPRWLLLRVATQTSIKSPDAGHMRYKIFMIYFMARVLELAVEHQIDANYGTAKKRKNTKKRGNDEKKGVSSDLLHIILAKLYRRIQKLGVVMKNIPWAEHAEEVITETMEIARSYIAKRWKTIQQSPNSAGKFRLSELKNLKPKSNTSLRLSKLRPYLQNIHNVRIDQRADTIFDGKCTARIDTKGSALPDLTLLMDRSPSETKLGLMDLELWVSQCLDSWLLKHTGFTKDMDSLSRLTNYYMSESVAQYTDSPEGISVMILTLMLLWVALDKSAVIHYPLLRKFDPGFPSNLLEPLLLPKRHQMAQLRDVEDYILRRKQNSSETNSSIFGDITSPSAFGAQYLDQSESHRVLKSRIEQEAKDDKDGKKRELKESKAEFARLMSLLNQLTCTFYMKTKCKYAKAARALYITCYEWPLPPEPSGVKCVVFELDIPSLIRSWRSTTFRILADVLSVLPPQVAKAKGSPLTSYTGLAKNISWFATEDSICLLSGLSYVMQDGKSQRLALEHLGKYSIHERCTLKLPQQSSYTTLQYALSGTKSHTPNGVMSLGHRLQWLNIARKLVSQTLNFGAEDVYLLLLQASWQAGPAALRQISRDSHIELEEESFGRDLLSALEAGMSSIESNWQGAVAALTYISLAGRLLSLSFHESVRARSLEFLKHARVVTLGWLRDVVNLLHDAVNESEAAYLSLRALDLALICHSTFDLDPRQLSSLLASTDSVTILVETATVVNDRLPLPEVPLTTLTRELLRRFPRTSMVLESTLKEEIIASPNALNKAVKRIWPGYESGSPWTMVDAPNDRWLTTRSLESENARMATCHYNILTGEFLINGRPLSRLSLDYEMHPTYKRLFGNKVLGVVPSSKGLYFETRDSIHGFQVHFALHEEQLIVRAIRGLEIYDIVTLSALVDDVPRTFLEDYVHWVHRGTLEVEWRPLESKWTPSSDNWRISKAEDTSASFLECSNKRVIEPESNTAKVIHRWLKPLESSTNINIFHNVDNDETEIRLPRMNLEFMLQKIGLESKQFRMIVDTNQYIGTFHGLLHKLVLRDIQGKSQGVIVPHGSVTFHRQEDHVQVFISTGSSDKVSHHKFDVDRVLGLLKDNGSLKSRLFKLYLHALTSHCLPHSLTGRTGSEEALHGLALHSTRSYPLDAEHVEQLKLFAKLTPARDFHPKASKFIQTVSWENLSPLSQHEGFIEEARLMLSRAETVRKFNPEEGVKYNLEQRGASELHARALIRNAVFRVDAFGAEKFTTSHDTHHSTARDSINNSLVESVACHVATVVGNWSCHLEPMKDLFLKIQSWEPIISGPLPNLKFEFDNRWLDNPARFMAQYWCSIQVFLTSADVTTDKFGIIFFLAILATSKFGNISLVHTLLALATSPGLRNLQPPPYESYDLSKGFEPHKASITIILDSCKVPYEESPEYQMPRDLNEQDIDLYQRRGAAYNGATKLRVTKCLNYLVRRWPTKDITCPQTADVQTYLPGLKDRLGEIQALFAHWHKNLEFRNYIEDIQTVLDSLLPPSNQLPDKYAIPHQEYKYVRLRAYFKIRDLLKNPAPQLPLPQQALGDLFTVANEDEVAGGREGHSKLKSLLGKLSRSATGNYQKNYVADLRKSYAALLTSSFVRHSFTAASPYTILKDHLKQATENVDGLYKMICSGFVISGSVVYESASKASLLPRLSPSILLKLLARFNEVVLSAEWKVALVRYALAIAAMQKAERLVACGERDSDILIALTNGGHTNWDPEEYPEWLLLELENNILIRPE